MADLQNWISSFILNPIRLSFFNRRTQFLIPQEDSGILQKPNSFIQENHSSKAKPVLEDRVFKLIYDSANHVFTNFGLQFNCMSVNKSNLLNHYRIHAAVEDSRVEFAPEDKMVSEETKPSFPTLSRSLPDCKRDRSTFMGSVCGSKFTRINSRLCFAAMSNITQITNLEIRSKPDDMAEEASNVEVVEISNLHENHKPDEVVQEPAPKTSRVDQANDLEEKMAIVQKDRKRKQDKKRKNRRRKQNRKNQKPSDKESLSSKDSDNSNAKDPLNDSNNEINSITIVSALEDGCLDIENDCDDMVIFAEESSSCNSQITSIAEQFFSFEFEDSPTDKDECVEFEEYDEMLFSNPLAIGNLNSRRPKPTTASSSTSTSTQSTKSSAIPISQNLTSYNHYTCISPSPDFSYILSEDDIKRNMIMEENDRKAEEELAKVNVQWKNNYSEFCGICENAVLNLSEASHKNKMIICPEKNSKVRFSDTPLRIIFEISEEESRNLAELPGYSESHRSRSMNDSDDDDDDNDDDDDGDCDFHLDLQ